MKIALVHDWLVNMGGAEKVLQAIYEVYSVPIYTLVLDRSILKNTNIENAEIHTSFIQNMPLAKKKYRYYLSFFPLAIEQFDLSEYDLIISSSHCVAKGILTGVDQLHISYIHTPIRYAWDMYYEYIRDMNFERGLRGLVFKRVLHNIRLWDVVASNRVDYFLSNSKFVASRINKIYRREATVLYPPVDTDKFNVIEKKEDYFITGSRLVPYKRIDLIVAAFAAMPDKRLVVIGDGPEMEKIKSIARRHTNIEILGYQPDGMVKKYMEARAFVFAAKEDFGIVPVEAQACGTPVIAYGKGGATETVIDGKTGVLFAQQTIEGLREGIERFLKIESSFDPTIIRKNAERFSKERFKEEFKKFVEEKWEDFKSRKIAT